MPFSCCGKMPVCLHLQGPPPPIGPSTAFPAEAKPPETSGALPNRWIAYLTAPAGAAASGRATRSSRHSVQQKLSLPSRKANTARPASAKRGKKASGAAVAAACPARGLTGGCLITLCPVSAASGCLLPHHGLHSCRSFCAGLDRWMSIAQQRQRCHEKECAVCHTLLVFHRQRLDSGTASACILQTRPLCVPVHIQGLYQAALCPLRHEQ